MLLLDEPTSALDAVNTRLVMRRLEAYRVAACSSWRRSISLAMKSTGTWISC